MSPCILKMQVGFFKLLGRCLWLLISVFTAVFGIAKLNELYGPFLSFLNGKSFWFSEDFSGTFLMAYLILHIIIAQKWSSRVCELYKSKRLNVTVLLLNILSLIRIAQNFMSCFGLVNAGLMKDVSFTIIHSLMSFWIFAALYVLLDKSQRLSPSFNNFAQCFSLFFIYLTALQYYTSSPYDIAKLFLNPASVAQVSIDFFIYAYLLFLNGLDGVFLFIKLASFGFLIAMEHDIRESSVPFTQREINVEL